MFPEYSKHVEFTQPGPRPVRLTFDEGWAVHLDQLRGVPARRVLFTGGEVLENEAEELLRTFPLLEEVTFRPAWFHVPAAIAEHVPVISLIVWASDKGDQDAYQGLTDALQDLKDIDELRLEFTDSIDWKSREARTDLLRGKQIRKLHLAGGHIVRGWEDFLAIEGLEDLEVACPWEVTDLPQCLRALGDLKRLGAWDLRHAGTEITDPSFIKIPEYQLATFHEPTGHSSWGQAGNVLGTLIGPQRARDPMQSGALARAIAQTDQRSIFSLSIPAQIVPEPFGPDETLAVARMTPDALLKSLRGIQSTSDLPWLFLRASPTLPEITIQADTPSQLQHALENLPPVKFLTLFVPRNAAYQQTLADGFLDVIEPLFRRLVIPRFEAFAGTRCELFPALYEAHDRSLVRQRTILALLAAYDPKLGKKSPFRNLKPDLIRGIAARIS